MRYTFTGKNITVSNALKERTESKINRLSRLFPEDTEIFVTFSVTKLENKIEVTVPLQKRILRAEVASNDMNVALDEVVDILEKQMVKYKNRLRDKSRKDASFRDEFAALAYDIEEDQTEKRIERIKKFALKPMDSEEAVMEMELLGHSFFVFRDSATDEVNVVYKRKNGSYGLIEPEY